MPLTVMNTIPAKYTAPQTPMIANIISTSFLNWEAAGLLAYNIVAGGEKCKRYFKTAVFAGKICTKCRKCVHKMQGYPAKIVICRIRCEKTAF